MKQQPIYLSLKDKTEVIIRSLSKADAEMATSYVNAMYADSPYLSRYPEEWTITAKDEAKFIESVAQDEKRLMLAAFYKGKLVGLGDFGSIGSGIKIAHRCILGISVASNMQGKGVGSLLLKTLLFKAKEIGFEQMELEVVAGNQRAIALYEKFGFETVGTLPHGFRYKEGYYEDLNLMVKSLV